MRNLLVVGRRLCRYRPQTAHVRRHTMHATPRHRPERTGRSSFGLHRPSLPDLMAPWRGLGLRAAHDTIIAVRADVRL